MISPKFSLSARYTSKNVVNKQRTNRHHSAHHDHRRNLRVYQNLHLQVIDLDLRLHHQSKASQNDDSKEKVSFSVWRETVLLARATKKIWGLASPESRCYLNVFHFTPPLNFIFKLRWCFIIQFSSLASLMGQSLIQADDETVINKNHFAGWLGKGNLIETWKRFFYDVICIHVWHFKLIMSNTEKQKDIRSYKKEKRKIIKFVSVLMHSL